ncbi:MAG: hypothetical protein PHP23_04020 [Desulfobacterales bacterium]|nr:hypothetical protein [Desulfobacterales bacterium]MDD4392953.1 hypothetical protein [Desulfobacterales bacterium]
MEVKTMSKALCIIAAIGILLLPAFTNAEPIMEYNAGDWEFILAGSGTSDNSFDTTTLSVQGGAGYFYTDNIELGIKQGISISDLNDGSSWGASTRFSLDYNFNIRNLKPFIGVNVGYLYGDDVKDTFIAGPEGGIKYGLNSTTFIYTQVEYQILFENADEIDNQFDDGRYVYTIGMGIKF